MVQLFYGKSGSGKSYQMMEQIKEDLINGRQVFLFVPDQDSMNAEQRMSKQLTDVPTCDLEILSFTRLPNRLFREYGGLCKQYISHGAKRIIMSHTLRSVANALQSYQKLDMTDTGMLDQLLAMIEEFKTYRILPKQLEQAADLLQESSDENSRILEKKVRDFAIIYSTYLLYLNEDFSDVLDDLSEVHDLLVENDFFHEKSVYFDGYYGFTPVQYKVIEQILIQSEKVAFSFSFDPQDQSQRWLLTKILDTDKQIKKLISQKKLSVKEILLKENHRTNSPDLRYLADILWNLNAVKKQTESLHGETVRVIECDNIHEETDLICRDILRQIRTGLRFSEITVVSRDIARYDGILTPIFEKYGIPFYFASREALQEKSLFRFLYSLLRIAIYRWRRDDVINLLKTGYFPISTEDACIFENYALAWNLTGARFLDENPYTLNPDGFTPNVSEQGNQILNTVNLVKDSLQKLLLPFFEQLNLAKTAQEISGVLYHFLCRLDVPATLDQKAEFCLKVGDTKAAQTMSQVWQTLLDIMDELVTVLGETKLETDEYYHLLDMIVSDTDLGSIPATVDAVTFGDAALLRPEGCRIMYLIGATDGSFPKNCAENTFFTDLEKERLLGQGIQLSPNATQSQADEIFYFYYALTCAKDKVVVSYYTSDYQGNSYQPSMAAERILLLYPELKNHLRPFSDSPESLEGRMPMAEEYGRYRYTDFGRAMFRFYRDRGTEEELKQIEAQTQCPIAEQRADVSLDTMKNILTYHFRMSPSRLEKYVQCHFSYFCSYILGLEENKKIQFQGINRGNFLHYVLEKFVSTYAQTNDASVFSSQYIDELLRGYMQDYLYQMTCNDLSIATSKRLIAMLDRLSKTAKALIMNLVDEFSVSEFRPVDFELPISERSDSEINPLTITLDDGTVVSLGGKVDRVDTYCKNGKTYVRVVDYKTGSKVFSLDEIRLGLNMQMLLYLFAIWKNGSKHYGGEVSPAGVLYLSAKTPSISGNAALTEEEIAEKVHQSFGRNGLLIDDPEILHAMDSTESGHFLPVTRNSNGFFSARSVKSLASLETFGKLAEEMSQTVKEITTELVAGKGDAVPICAKTSDIDINPCQWCEMKPICRQTKTERKETE